VAPFFKATAPVLKNQINPFTRAAQPLVRQLIAPAQQLSASSPALTNTFVVLNHLFNMLGYNPYGKQHYSSSIDGTYLFWLAWLAHNGDAVFGTADANGPFRALTQTSTCTTLQAEAHEIDQQAQATMGPGTNTNGVGAVILGLSNILTNPNFCG
jgi:phospholipid/cholesterol/gamma-HCH transport system substrate-binding protein